MTAIYKKTAYSGGSKLKGMSGLCRKHTKETGKMGIATDGGGGPIQGADPSTVNCYQWKVQRRSSLARYFKVHSSFREIPSF